MSPVRESSVLPAARTSSDFKLPLLLSMFAKRQILLGKLDCFIPLKKKTKKKLLS